MKGITAKTADGQNYISFGDDSFIPMDRELDEKDKEMNTASGLLACWVVSMGMNEKPTSVPKRPLTNKEDLEKRGAEFAYL